MTVGNLPLARAVRGMSATRRLLVFGVAAAAVVLVWLVGRWAAAPTYATLYHDLELNDAAAMAERLAKTNVDYKLGGGGTEILVPVSDLARARVALAKDGLTANGRPGLELFDKPSWGMTDFTERVTYQRALEGELARTIGGLQGVQRAQVHLVLPTPSPLRRYERPAGASVVITLKPGVSLSPEAVQGITYIVSNSVEQLAAENVAVMDDAGHVLSVPAAAGSASGLTSRQLEIQHSVEEHLAGKIEELLATVVGLGRVRAQVAAELSFDQVDRTVDTFDPDGQVLQNEQRSETEGGAGAEGAGTGAQTVLNNSYQNSRRLEKITGSVGDVTRLTVAVLVDEKAVQGGAGGKTVALGALEAMVRDAVGADSTRGDRVSVMAVPFEPVQALPASTGGRSDAPKVDVLQVTERFSRPLIGVVAIVVLALLAWRALSAPGAAPAPVRAEAGPNGAEAAARELPGQPGGEVLALRNRLLTESNDRPEAAAQVLRSWLSESS
jgi:flagellar M-ring protein FliF